MRTRPTEIIKSAVRPWFYRALHPRKPRFRCPVCGYHGPFKDKVESPTFRRTDSKCPRCASIERHRLAWLVLDELFEEWRPAGRSILHIAPEYCLQPRLRASFATYHSSDLFRKDVDFQADLQDLPFEDASYDCVFVSRVLTIPPDLDACLREIRRVLKPGGVAIISEVFVRDRTAPDPDPTTEAARFMGVDFVDDLRARFARVDCPSSSGRPDEFQLVNRFIRDGRPWDEFPEFVREPGVGAREVLLLCWAPDEAKNPSS
ncbi:MAG: class I SAM-dependent methyltransferase [Phycisphaerales bacterium]